MRRRKDENREALELKQFTCWVSISERHANMVSNSWGARWVLNNEISEWANRYSAILNCKAGISRNFRYYRQEDAHELMVSLLESMHKCCLPSGIASESPCLWEESSSQNIWRPLKKSGIVNCIITFVQVISKEAIFVINTIINTDQCLYTHCRWDVQGAPTVQTHLILSWISVSKLAMPPHWWKHFTILPRRSY
jgi:hypothetical protein